MGKILFLLLMCATAHLCYSQNLRYNPIFKRYAQSGDLDAFCESYRKEFDRECKDDIPDGIDYEFTRLISQAGDYKIRAFLDEHIMIMDPLLDMSAEECSRFHDEMRKTPNNQVGDVIYKYAVAKGYVFAKREFKTMKAIRETAEQVKASDNCNVGFQSRHLGDIEKGWRLKFLSPITAAIDDLVRNIKLLLPSFSTEANLNTSPNESDGEHIEAIDCDARISLDSIKSCVGSKIIQLAEEDTNLKTFLLALSKGVCYYRMYSAMDFSEFLVRLVLLAKEHCFLVCMLLLLPLTFKYLKRVCGRRSFGKVTFRKVCILWVVSATLLSTAGLHEGYPNHQEAFYVMALGMVIIRAIATEDRRDIMAVVNFLTYLYAACCLSIEPIEFKSLWWIFSVSLMRLMILYDALRNVIRAAIPPEPRYDDYGPYFDEEDPYPEEDEPPIRDFGY